MKNKPYRLTELKKISLHHTYINLYDFILLLLKHIAGRIVIVIFTDDIIWVSHEHIGILNRATVNRP